MNIFVTDTCPTISAINLPDILVRKMIVETAQLLSGAHILLDDNKVAYKLTHKTIQVQNGFVHPIRTIAGRSNIWKLYAVNINIDSAKFTKQNSLPYQR